MRLPTYEDSRKLSSYQNLNPYAPIYPSDVNGQNIKWKIKLMKRNENSYNNYSINDPTIISFHS